MYILSNSFAEICVSNLKTSDIFSQKTKCYETSKTEKFIIYNTRHHRLARSSLIQMSRYLNSKSGI